jgi:hypothetical protein
MKFAYLVKSNDGKIGITFNKRVAIKTAKFYHGTIRFMSYSLYNYPACKGDITGRQCWDYPTFFCQSEELKF